MLHLKLDISNRPWHIKNLINKLESCYKNREYGLNNILVHLMFKNPSLCKVHPERYEAIIRVLQVMVYFTDFRTGNIGKLNPSTGEFTHMSIDAIAFHSGLNLRRVQRVLRDLSVTDYFKSKKRVEKISEFVYKSLNSIKKLSDKLFHHLGLRYETLKKIRRHKEHEYNEKIHKNDFHKTEVEFIRKNVFNSLPKNQHRTFTEKIPRNMIDIIIKKFSN